MRNLWIFGVVALVVVGALAFYANSLIGDVRARDEKLEKEFEQRAAALLRLDEEHAYTPRATLDAARLAIYLNVRAQTAKFFRGRLQEPSQNAFHGRETRNEVLMILASALDARKMSLKEYMAISRRWQSLLARGDRLGLMTDWKRVVNSKEHPGGLPLPAAAMDATKEELELFRANEEALKKDLEADLLGPTLERIESEAGRPDGSGAAD